MDKISPARLDTRAGAHERNLKSRGGDSPTSKLLYSLEFKHFAEAITEFLIEPLGKRFSSGAEPGLGEIPVAPWSFLGHSRAILCTLCINTTRCCGDMLEEAQYLDSGDRVLVLR